MTYTTDVYTARDMTGGSCFKLVDRGLLHGACGALGRAKARPYNASASYLGSGYTNKFRLPRAITASLPSGVIAKSRNIKSWNIGVSAGWVTGGSWSFAPCAVNSGTSTHTRSPDFFSGERFSKMRDSSGDH